MERAVAPRLGFAWRSAPRARRRRPDPDVVSRRLDLAIALPALIFLAPLLLVIAAVVFLGDGASPVFRQRRIGRDGRPFDCLKFRSMTRDADARLARLLAECPLARAEWERDRKLRRDPRITAVGGFLRRSSLDELPQMFNVLRGEMSVVGPRPIVADEIARYGGRFGSYCAVRPGITGLWQVSGRSDTTYRRRVACDVVYARRRGLATDLRILAATVPAVLSARGSC